MSAAETWQFWPPEKPEEHVDPPTPLAPSDAEVTADQSDGYGDDPDSEWWPYSRVLAEWGVGEDGRKDE